jgi:IclR family acetate operon transcriptional repressor
VSAIVGRTGLESRTPATIAGESALLDHLEVVRERGYALDEEENEPGIRCVGTVSISTVH